MNDRTERRNPLRDQSDLRAATAALRHEVFGVAWIYENTEQVVDCLVGCAAGRALLRRRLAEHDGTTARRDPEWLIRRGGKEPPRPPPPAEVAERPPARRSAADQPLPDADRGTP